MLASYFLSRTVVPTFVHFLLRGQPVYHDEGTGHTRSKATSSGACMSASTPLHPLSRSLHPLPRLVPGAQADDRPGHGRSRARHRPARVLSRRDFFPVVDAGSSASTFGRRPAPGSRRPRSSSTSRGHHPLGDPKGGIDQYLDNIGLPTGGVNLAFSDSATIGPPTAKSSSPSTRKSTVPPGPTCTPSGKS